ncbi:MAG: hypothetical protein MUC96_14445 [Myxococcaceae bacterium]|nr:hypothetical protein [Myxococcaceae bacterium]
MPRATEPSELLAKLFEIPGPERLDVVRPTKVALNNLDQEWSQLRSADDVARDWCWATVADDPDVFAVRDELGGVLALWRACRPIITLQKRVFYRLDNIEVKPGERGRALGRFVLALVAFRAIELAAQRIILAAPPERVAWYQSVGAVDASDLRWKYPAELKALQFEETLVLNMKEVASALEVKK